MLREQPRDERRIRDVPFDERYPAIAERAVQVQEAARVRQLVEYDEPIRGVLERVANEVGADEAGSPGDKKRSHQWLDRRPFGIHQREAQLLGERIDGRARALPRAFGFEAEIADAAA